MAEKPRRETLEDVARREAENERAKAEALAERAASGSMLAKAVPERFFAFARELRQSVQRFNDAGDPQKRILWDESPAVAAQELSPGAELHCSFKRPGGEVTVGLNAMSRSGKPDAYLIEGSGRIREDTFLLRVEGMVQKGKVVYRVSVDLKRLEIPLEELSDRLVMAVVKQDVREIYKGV